MTDLNPTDIYHRYQRNELDKAQVVDYLKSIIESSRDEELRVQSVEILGEMNLKAGEIFEFFEQLLTSDLNEKVRIVTAKLIVTNYLDVSEDLLKWIFKQEQSVDCLLEIQKALLIDINQKQRELLSVFETIFNNRFPDYNYWKREEMGIGQSERLLGKIQPYLIDVMFYDDLDILALDKLFDEIVELAELELISDNISLNIMQLVSDRYLAEGAAEHDWHERWLSYKKAMESSEFGLIFNPNDKKLLFNFGVACNYLDLYYPAINAFLRLYKIEKKLDKKKYKKLKKIKKQGGMIVEYGRSGPIYYLAQLYKTVGLFKKEKWAREQNRKRKQKFRKLTTGF